MGEKISSLFPELSSAHVLSISIEHERLIKIDERKPHIVSLATEKLTGLLEQLPCAANISLATGDKGEVCNSFRFLIRHAQPAEASKSPLGQLACLVAQVQLQINLRTIQVAQCAVVNILDPV